MWHLATWTFMATTKHFSVTFSLKTRHTRLRRIRSQKRIRDERDKSALAMASTASTVSWSSSWLNSLGGNLSEATKLSDRRTALVVFAQKKATKTRKIILKEDVADLGKIGQLLDVKAGYYRNYLLPMGKAQIVTPALLKEMRMEEERIEAEKTRAKDEAQQLALSFETVGAFKVRRKGGKGKQIFGSVTAQDLVDIIKAQLQRDVDKRIVSLPEIRETGEYIAELRLHPEVTARVRLTVYAN